MTTLVAETLVLAKTHGYVEKIESELEEELARDFSDPPEDRILRWRRKGDTIFKSKHVLLTVVILCVLDCALVLGELALDLYKVKATLSETSDLTGATHAFVSKMAELHPALKRDSPYETFNLLLNAVFIWTDEANTSHLASPMPTVPCSNTTKDIDSYLAAGMVGGQGRDNGTVTLTLPGFPRENSVQDKHDLEVVVKIAHIFHYLSIAILFIILIETILKAVCAGRSFFHRKIEVFDALIVLLSFVVDFCFLTFLPDIDTKDFVFILAILLPWRVIRVVNSLVVSVKDHEHFRLKLVYKRKKKIQGNLRDTEAMLQKYMCQVTTLQRLCIMEGIEEWKVDNYLKNEEQAQPVTPNKRKFKFKFDDSSMQGHNRVARCSLPSLDFHGIRLPTNIHVSKSRISLPAVASSIKNTLSKTLPSRRASLASIELFGTKMSNGDVRKKKGASEDLGTMEEENIDDLDLDNHDSALSSRATSESGDVFSRLSVSDSIGSDRIFPDIVGKNGNKRRDSAQTVGDKDERDKLARIKEEAKRRHSESNIIDKQRVSLTGLTEGVCYTTQSGKTYTKPQTETSYNQVELHSVTEIQPDCIVKESDRKECAIASDGDQKNDGKLEKQTDDQQECVLLNDIERQTMDNDTAVSTENQESDISNDLANYTYEKITDVKNDQQEKSVSQPVEKQSPDNLTTSVCNKTENTISQGNLTRPCDKITVDNGGESTQSPQDIKKQSHGIIVQEPADMVDKVESKENKSESNRKYDKTNPDTQVAPDSVTVDIEKEVQLSDQTTTSETPETTDDAVFVELKDI